ncbi:MAG: HAD family phosphatase [Firmicutes bacterium]|jgi:Cof subfamily protein (haloacid dehalogenase superfamily)|nr:HAD family phosphatase [Bacillota bacterium]
MIRLVALDLDDTLLRPDLTISPACRQALREAAARGVKITIASGRMYRATLPFAEILEISGIPLITYNGAFIRFSGYGETLFHQGLPTAAAGRLIVALRRIGLHINAFVNDELYMEELSEEGKRYIERNKVPVKLTPDLTTVLTSGPTKIMAAGDPEAVVEAEKELNAEFKGEIVFVRSRPRFLECLAPGVNKGLALEKVAGFYGLDAREVMAVGDAPNDREMLAWAGVGVAMDGAPPEVRAVADWTAPSNREDGVAAALHKFVLGK